MLRQTSREIGVMGLVGVRSVTVEGLSENTQIRPCGFIDLARGWPCAQRKGAQRAYGWVERRPSAVIWIDTISR